MKEFFKQVWHRDKLKLILAMSDPFLKTVLDHVVARDVVMKLVQVSAIIIFKQHPNENI